MPRDSLAKHLGAHISTALLAMLLAMGPAHADQIDDLVNVELKRQHIPGLGIAIVKNGRIVKEKGYGIANVEHAVPVTPLTVFQSGSVGKQFTAALTMLLVDDGKIKLDEPLSTYLPDAPQSWAGITVRHLLTHTSGMDSIDRSIDLRKDYSEEALLQSSFKVPLLSAPGETWRYSNLGYQVLGILCSKVGGKFYGDQLRERIFEPSGMRASIISERNIVPHRAAGYDRINGVLTNQDWVAPTLNTTGDGSLYVTARDLARWSIALDGDKVLSKSIKESSWTPARLNDGSSVDYGFGWKLETVSGHKVVRHRGDWQGFTSHMARFVDDRLTVIVLTNRSRAQPDVVVDKIAGHYIADLRSRKAESPSAAAIASVPMFLRGSMNEWGTRDPLMKVEQAIYEAQVTLSAGTHPFKIASEDWTALDMGAPFDEPLVVLDQAKFVGFRGENLVVEVPKAGRYVFRLDARNARRPLVTIKLAAGSQP